MSWHLSSNLTDLPSYLMLDLIHNSPPQICPKKSELVHGFTFSRSQVKSVFTFCLVPQMVQEDLDQDQDQDQEDQVTAFQGLEDTLACLDATYLNLEQKLLDC